MAGIYTQKRIILPSGNPARGMVWNKYNVLTHDVRGSCFADQVTTSYRTGKGESLVSERELSDNNNYLNNLLQTKAATYDTGHPFTTVKRTAFLDFPNFRYTSKLSDGNTFYGPFVAKSMVFVQAKDYPVVPEWKTLNSDGNKAILETYPTKPGVSLSQTIVELKREGLPSLFGAQIASMKGSAARAIGGEFLNSVFGWTPLIADLDKLLKSVVSSSQTIQQMQRDSGRLVRRKFHFPQEQTLVTVIPTSMEVWPFGTTTGSPLNGVQGKLTIEETITVDKWFSGAYTYYIDPGKDLVGKAIMYEQLANKLLGLRLTPALLWELAPWSWLADWYANIGENLTVASAFNQDGLVLKYGYVMRKVTAERLYTFTPHSGQNLSLFPTSRMILRTTSKERFKSTPFGFGLNTASFNDRQWAILGALGLTKAPKSLR